MEYIDIGRLDLFDLQKTVDLYRNLFYHRTAILEGIRKIAARNMIHLARVSENCQSCHTHKDDDFISCVQQRMLLDQGLEDNQWNRTLLGVATFCPLKVYLALLNAEIEYYWKVCHPSVTLRDDIFSSYIKGNGEWVARLQDFRDPFLHPNKQRESSELNFLTHEGSYNLAPEIQKHIDEYLLRLKQKLFKMSVDKLFCLSEHQRLVCTVMFRMKNLERMKLHHDVIGISHVFGLLESLCEERSQNLEQLFQEATSRFLTQRQQRNMDILSECLNQVCPSGPEQQFSIEPTVIQTPMSELAVSQVFGSDASALHSNGRASAHARQNAEGFRELLLVAAVLWNEVLLSGWQAQPKRNISQEELTTIAKAHALGVYSGPSAHDPEKIGLQRANEVVAPSRVNTAILYEPLRIYADIVRDNPLGFSPSLAEWTDAIRLHKLKIFRNSVFHVVHRAWEVDLAIVDTGFDLSELFAGLAQFYGIKPIV